MKVVKRINDNKIMYRSIPDFAEGVGIENAVILYGISDYEEIEITEDEWNIALLAGNIEGL